MAYIKRYDAIGPFTYQYRTGASKPWITDQWSSSNYIEMASIGHDLPINTERDDGGAWLMEKTIHKFSNGYPVGNRLFEGPVNTSGPAGWTGDNLNRPSSPSDSTLLSHGTTMVARSLPNNPSSDIIVGMAEVAREGVPSIIGLQTMRSRAHAARNAGSEYLNVEFGWKPLVSEVRSLATSVRDSEAIWSNYRKGSSHKTRVGYHLDDDIDTVSYTGGGFLPIPNRYNRFLQGTKTVAMTNHTWFKGAFKYFVPTPTDFDSKMSYWSSQASKILGVRMDPEVLWNLAPWSWAVDWFSNTGDVLHNISLLGKDGLVMQYGYAMSEQKLSKSAYASDVGFGVYCSNESVSKRCRRLPANPYGFGVTISSLSARQVAIIAALGLSST
jgi:hypothetical protein